MGYTGTTHIETKGEDLTSCIVPPKPSIDKAWLSDSWQRRSLIMGSYSGVVLGEDGQWICGDYYCP